MTGRQALQAWLESVLAERGAVAGSVHVRDGDELRLAAAVRLPPPVLEAVRRVPYGKGMAGLSWARRVPVQTCNLQTDESGDVRPGARAVDANAAVAVPVDDRTGTFRAVVGFAFAEVRAIDEVELASLSAVASTLPE